MVSIKDFELMASCDVIVDLGEITTITVFLGDKNCLVQSSRLLLFKNAIIVLRLSVRDRFVGPRKILRIFYF